MEGVADDESIDEAPTRSFQAMGHEWVVRVTGSASSGSPPSVTVPLMQMEFRRAGDASDSPLLAVDLHRPLEGIPVSELQTLLENARPTPATKTEPEPEAQEEGKRSKSRGR
jgi:hypothetical protein